MSLFVCVFSVFYVMFLIELFFQYPSYLCFNLIARQLELFPETFYSWLYGTNMYFPDIYKWCQFILVYLLLVQLPIFINLIRFLKTTVVKYRNQIINTIPFPLSLAWCWLIMIFAGHCSHQLSNCLILKACRWLPFLSGLFPSRRPHINQAWSPALFTPRTAPRWH